MKVGLLIPTLPSRSEFLDRALIYLSRQTRQPDQILILSESGKPLPDITWKYHQGFNKLFADGCDCVICFEDDDAYSDTYIEIMVQGWVKSGKPDLFGIGKTIYYHIVDRKYVVLDHPARASMMSTLVTKAVLNHSYDYHSPYLDFALWTSALFTKKTFTPTAALCIGIKHGFGPVGGGGHQRNWAKYTHSDPQYKSLDAMLKQDAVFYKMMAVKDNYLIGRTFTHENPFLSIITRRHGQRRPKGWQVNQSNMRRLKGDFEQITITDKKGMGLHYANMSFVLACPYIRGKYVYLLDDDDLINNPEMIPVLQEIAEKENPDVIVFRMIIKNGMNNNLYPTEACWRAKKPMLAHIGGSCMVVKADVFKRHIHHFGHPRFGDFYFLDHMYKTGKLKWHWHYEIMAETGGRPSHGKVEVNI